MKASSQIWAVVAAGALALGLLGAAGIVAAADGTKPSYNGYQPRSSDPTGNDYHANSNSNDYHANYHADYSVTQDGRPNQPPADDKQDPRQDERKFQDGDRYLRSPYSRR